MAEFAKLFLGLPESIVVDIFNKVEDVKRLYHFYSISENIASLVTQTHSISVEVPYEMALFSGKEAEWPDGVMKFLDKFQCIELMTIRFTEGVAVDNGNHLLRWRGDINGLIFLKEQDDAEEGFNRPRIPDCPTRVKYINSLLEKFPSIKKISSLDYANQGVVYLEEDAVKDIKNLNLMMDGLPHEELELTADVQVKKWKMELPFGTMLKQVYFYSEINENSSEKLMIKKAFPEDELRELVDIILQTVPYYEAHKILVKFHCFI